MRVAPQRPRMVSVSRTQAGQLMARKAVVRSDGTVDLSEQAPEAGSYGGVDGTGLLWSMLPAEGSENRFFSKRLTTPMVVVFTVESAGEILAETTAVRHFGAQDVRIRPADGQLVGRLMAPADGEPRPGVLVLAGSDGGVLDHATCLLAAQDTPCCRWPCRASRTARARCTESTWSTAWMP